MVRYVEFDMTILHTISRLCRDLDLSRLYCCMVCWWCRCVHELVRSSCVSLFTCRKSKGCWGILGMNKNMNMISVSPETKLRLRPLFDTCASPYFFPGLDLAELG